MPHGPSGDGKTLRRSRLTRRRALAAAAGMAGAGLLSGAWAHWVEPNRLSLTRVRIRVPGWPAGRPPLRIGQLSDLHCNSGTSVDRARRAAAMLMAQQPDLVVLTGDFVTSHGEQWAEAAADAIAPVVAAPLGGFAVLGNHDYWTNSADVVAREVERLGIPVLRNEPARVRRLGNVWVLGVDSISTGRADAKVTSLGVPADAVRLMLVHEPDFADYAGVRVSLQISGHSHGGQIRLPGLPVYSPAGARKYHMGFYRTATHPLFVSRGIGMIGVPFRFRCPPEVVVLTLEGADSTPTGTAAPGAA